MDTLFSFRPLGLVDQLARYYRDWSTSINFRDPSEPPRLLILSERYHGCGASIAAYRIACALAETRAFKVTYAYLDPKNIGAPPKPASLTTLCYRNTNPPWVRLANIERRLRKKSKHFSYDYSQSLKVLNDYVEAWQPDVVNIHNTELALDDLIALFKEKPIYWTLHDQYPTHGYNYSVTLLNGERFDYIPKKSEFAKHSDEKLRRHLDQIQFIGPSEWICEQTRQQHPGAKATKLVNPMNTKALFPVEKPLAKAMVGVPDNRPAVLFIQGRYAHERKNIGLLKRYLEQTPPEETPVNFIVIGANLIDSEKARADVIYRHQVSGPDALRRWYSAADYTCMPSLEENYPNVGIESALCGTPLLGSNRGGIPEQVSLFDGGISFDPYSLEDFAAAIDKAASQSKSEAKLPWVLHEQAAKDHSIHAAASAYANIMLEGIETC